MTEITHEATVGAQVQQAMSAMMRWVSRAEVRAELFGPQQRAMSLTDVWLLEAIVIDGPIRAGDLAAWQGVDKSTVTPQLRRLEQRGLIARKPDPRDNRAALLTATAAGKRLHRKIVGIGARVFDDLLEGWSEPDRRALGALFSRFAAEVVGRPAPR